MCFLIKIAQCWATYRPKITDGSSEVSSSSLSPVILSCYKLISFPSNTWSSTILSYVAQVKWSSTVIELMDASFSKLCYSIVNSASPSLSNKNVIKWRSFSLFLPPPRSEHFSYSGKISWEQYQVDLKKRPWTLVHGTSLFPEKLQLYFLKHHCSDMSRHICSLSSCTISIEN